MWVTAKSYPFDGGLVASALSSHGIRVNIGNSLDRHTQTYIGSQVWNWSVMCLPYDQGSYESSAVEGFQRILEHSLYQHPGLSTHWQKEALQPVDVYPIIRDKAAQLLFLFCALQANPIVQTISHSYIQTSSARCVFSHAFSCRNGVRKSFRNAYMRTAVRYSGCYRW